MKKENNRRAKKGRLARTSMIKLILIMVALVVEIGIISGFVVYKHENQIYRDFAQSFSRVLSESISGDSIKGYLESKVKDQYYENINEMMQRMLDDASLHYLYVYVPEDEGIRYVWEVRSSGEHRQIGDVWYYNEEYPKDKVLNAFYTGSEVFFLYQYKSNNYAAYVTPIYDSDNNVVALVEADIIMPYSDMIFPTLLRNILLGVVIVLVIVLIPFYFNLKRKVIEPLEKLNTAATTMVEQIEQESDIVIDVHTGDEIEILSDSMVIMNRKLKGYVKENEAITAEKERVKAEIDTASRIQSAMLPSVSSEIFSRKEFDIYADMTPARDVGGDLYDFFLVDDNHLAIVIGDVSDKGISAALFMVLAKNTLQNQIMIHGTEIDKAVDKANELLVRDNATDMFVTAWVGVLALDTGVLRFVNAGHELAAISRNGSRFVLLDDNHSSIVGILEDIPYRINEIKLNKGDTLYIYTDGVVEALNVDDKMYGLERMLSALNDNIIHSPQEIDAALRENLREFMGDAEQFDDITTLCLRYYGYIS